MVDANENLGICAHMYDKWYMFKTVFEFIKLYGEWVWECDVDDEICGDGVVEELGGLFREFPKGKRCRWACLV